MGAVAVKQAELLQAASYLSNASLWERESNRRGPILQIFIYVAGLALALDRPESTLHLGGAITALGAAWNRQLMPFDNAELARLLAAARQRLSSQAADDAWNKGKAMSMEEAVAHGQATLDLFVNAR
jgi:hypothetical protein